MNTSTVLGRTITQAVPNPTGSCNACQRTGLPILPLRAAYAPPPDGTHQQRLPKDSDIMSVSMRMDQPRILRRGYLYVLLDKKVWQAYQVTPEGALRQFRPYQLPREEPQPLSEACIRQDHDITASFINIDTEKYNTALIAFSGDPWPKSVLDRYRLGKAEDGTVLEPRFVKLDLKLARENPASVGIAMTEQALQVDRQVLEYATLTPGDFASVHGFYARSHRLVALSGFVRLQAQRQHLSHGVLALVLPDPVGVVQELNHQRLAWQRQRQAYEADPLNNYKYFTSETLKRLRELCKQTADQSIADSPNAMWETMPSESGGPPVFGDPARERAEQVAYKAKQLLARLEERYDEGKRAAFEKAFDATRQRLQQQVDDMAKLYVSRLLTDPQFQLAERYDYDPRMSLSVVGYIQTMELCLSGGITEATPRPDTEGNPQPVTGPSASAWEAWIQDGQSIVFKTLLACDQNLMQGLVPTLRSKGELDWNDFEKLYTPVAKIITSSDLGEKLTRSRVQAAIASVLAAYNGAVSRLETRIATGARNAATRVNSAALLLYSHTYMTQVAVRMTLGEFYTLMCEQIREDHNRIAKAIRQETGKMRRQVRSVLMGGVLSLALSDPKLAGQTVEVVLWVEGKASDLRQRFGGSLHEAGKALGDGARWASNAVSDLKVLTGTLEPEARKVLAGLQLRAFQVTGLARSGLSGARSAATIARGTVGSAELLIAVGGTYLLSQGLRKSVDTVDATLGVKHDEAVLAVYSAAVGVLGGSIEAVGLTMKGSAQQAQKVLRLPASGVSAMSTVAEAGKVLARFGAVLGAVSGGFDATAAVTAARRTYRAGDNSAAILYGASATFYSFSAGIAVFAATRGATAILSATLGLGPIGWVVILGTLAYVAWKLAEGSESSPLERWALYSYFGKADDKLKWADADTAVAALNAAVLGVDAFVKFGSTLRVEQPTGMAVMGDVAAALTYVPQLEYQIVLPRYDALRASYTWQLVVKRYSREEVLASGNHQSARPTSNAGFKPPKRLDYDPKTVAPTLKEQSITAADGSKTNFLIVTGKIELMVGHDIDEATINLEYLPDIQDTEMVTTLRITEVK